MRKSLLFALLIVFGVAKLSFGQTSMTLLDARYEYHPHLIKGENFNFDDAQEVHMLKLGLLGVNAKMGKNIAVEWKIINFTLSSYDRERFGVSLSGFAIRFGHGRFQPSINCDLLEFTTYKKYNPIEIKAVIHNSIAVGFNYYVNDTGAFTCFLGVTKENNRYTTPFISPFISIGYRIEYADVVKRLRNL